MARAWACVSPLRITARAFPTSNLRSATVLQRVPDWASAWADLNVWSMNLKSFPDLAKELGSRLRDGNELMMIEVKESSQTGEARRKAAELAQDLQLGEVRAGAVALVATEMATNLVKHAGNGTMLFQRVRENGSSGLRIMAIDKGPGIADVTRALQDGHSTAGSMGTGLGAVRRVADQFEVYSASGMGTLIRAEFWPEAHQNPHSPRMLITGVVSEPI